jgi:hypothetical protein
MEILRTSPKQRSQKFASRYGMHRPTGWRRVFLIIPAGEVGPRRRPVMSQPSLKPPLASMLVVLVSSAMAAVVLVDHRVSLATRDEPAVDREGRHESDRQGERQAAPEEQAS